MVGDKRKPAISDEGAVKGQPDETENLQIITSLFQPNTTKNRNKSKTQNKTNKKKITVVPRAHP